MDLEEQDSSKINIVSCMCFVRKGVAKAIPDKVEITEKELECIIKQTANDLRLQNNESGESDDDDDEATSSNTNRQPSNPDDEFDFDKYDEDDDLNPLGIGSVATLPNLGDLGDNINIRTEGADSDEEDDYIKPKDNLLLVGHVESDASVLEVYIYNKDEDSFYVHHDIVLPWFPLAMEWLSHDPSDPQPGNLCALGGMDPVIQVWDLDIENCLEPAFKLGKKANKKKNIKRVGHRDAVLDLAWNKNFTHVLASGSADKTVLLWDLDKGEPHTKLSYYTNTVQTLCWHPHEAQTLLSGSSDGNGRVSDCRTDDAFRMWQAGGEVEKVAWNTQNPFCFAMSNNVGKISYIDVRNTEPLWTLDAHEGEIPGLILSDKVHGMMISVGSDSKIKTWDILDSSGPVQVSEKSSRVGKTLSAAICPEHPGVIAVGGDNKECFIQVHDLMDNEQVNNKFGSRLLVEQQMDL